MKFTITHEPVSQQEAVIDVEKEEELEEDRNFKKTSVKFVTWEVVLIVLFELAVVAATLSTITWFG